MKVKKAPFGGMVIMNALRSSVTPSNNVFDFYDPNTI